jgi:phosphatidylglycerol:prolipoprotein diacylglycerol transferase
MVNLFDVLTGLGIFLGIYTTRKAAQSRNLPEKNIIDAILISLATGFLGAHWMHIILYERSFSFSNIGSLFEVWKGISSTGGLLAGAIGCWIFLKAKKLPILLYGDCMIMGVWVALFFGRLGCTFVFDHPGAQSDFFLATQHPLFGTRHNLGMYEAIFLGLFLVAVKFTSLGKFLQEKTGRWVVYPVAIYGLVRFCLDFLRATDIPSADPRYLGLTPAQYTCLFFIGYALFQAKKISVGTIKK